MAAELMSDRHHEWAFRLYVAGNTPLGQRALANLRALVERHLPGGADITLIDLRETPKLALEDRVLAVPMVFRERPEPKAGFVGDLSDPVAASKALDLPAPDRP